MSGEPSQGENDPPVGAPVDDHLLAEESSESRGQVGLFIASRVAINASYRMVYPFLGSFASGMGIPLQTAVLPLTWRSITSAFGPLLAPVADRHGRKIGMLLGLCIFSIGVTLVALWPSFPSFFAALVLANLGNQVFLPAVQAYLGDRIPYRRRGAVLAMTELSWSLSFIILVPLLGLLIGRAGWASPFWVLSAAGFAAVGLILWRVPADRPHQHAGMSALSHGLRDVFASPAARAALLFNLCITTGNEVVNLVFGVWMYDAFRLDAASLGLAAAVIGLAELAGETATVTLVDRIGKKRAVTVGVISTSIAALLLPWLGQSLWGALLGLFLFYLSFEFTLVSYIPLMTEVLPSARATLMSTNLAASSLGRGLGALAGPWSYAAGFGANTQIALLLNALALIALSHIRVKD